MCMPSLYSISCRSRVFTYCKGNESAHLNVDAGGVGVELAHIRYSESTELELRGVFRFEWPLEICDILNECSGFQSETCP